MIVSFICTRNSLNRKSHFNVLNCEDSTHQSNCPRRFSQLVARYLKRQKLINVVIVGFQNMFQITQVKLANLFDLLNQMKNWLN